MDKEIKVRLDEQDVAQMKVRDMAMHNLARAIYGYEQAMADAKEPTTLSELAKRLNPLIESFENLDRLRQ